MAKFTRKQRERLFGARQAGIVLFAMLMLTGSLVGAAGARPSVSVLENRNLTPFPEFSIRGFLDGTFFGDLSLWYADTYPAREALVGSGQSMKGLFGIQPEAQMVGSGKQADQIPPGQEGSAADGQDSTDDNRSGIEESKEREAEELTEDEMLARIQEQLVGNIYLLGDAAYSFYWFSQEQSDSYAQAINQAADALAGQAQVYSLLVPTSGGIMLGDAERQAAGASDESQAIDYFKGVFNDRVKVVDCYDALKQHNSEYLYFRTDHHWTQRGAYYAYVEFCRQRGTQPADVLSWEQIDSGDLLGSLYAELGAPQAMADNPDDVVGYVPTSTNDLQFEYEGEMVDSYVISDGSDWELQAKYLTYITGDQPLIRIDNPTRTDGPSCLVVKDSYGNPFVPCLVDDYQSVYVIDVRYSSRSILDFVRENAIDDVIFENSLSLTADYTIRDLLVAQTAQ